MADLPIKTRALRRRVPESGLARPRRAPSTRVRLLGWYMLLMAGALVAGMVLLRGILMAQLNNDVDAQLRQEVEELERISTGRNPDTAQPFGNDIEAIFDTFLSTNIPSGGEALFTLIDGRPDASTVAPLQLLDDPAVVAEWAALTVPRQGELKTAAGEVRYLAVPVFSEDGRSGVFVVTAFMREDLSEVNDMLQTGGIVFGSIFLCASVVAWFAAGRILRPVRLLTDAALSIKDDNWSQRIPVKGDDEIARLARTFNDMLDRLETAFVTQRGFIDDAGHELRTPITIIRGHLEVAGESPEEQAEVKRLVLDELDRMSRFVEDLLLLARAEQPDFLDGHPLDVAELTEEVTAKAEGLSGGRAWQMAEAAQVVVTADRQRLTQAMMNLARNAVEHTPEGSTIELGSNVKGGVLRLWVKDEGEGITDADQERIFERFARGRSGQRRSDGAGLGLAIVKTIAEAHGGHVELESAPGQGATFTLVLPAGLESER